MHQVLTNVSVRFLSRHVAYERYPFNSQAAKHSLYRCIIPTISTTAPALTHTLAHAMPPWAIASIWLKPDFGERQLLAESGPSLKPALTR
jgi:hypothetical protein